MKRNLLAMLALVSACGAALAQATPVGVWKSIDDKTKTERSQVRISESGGVLSGRIEKLLATDAKPDAKCDKCEDDRKDKPIVGMEIIRGVKKAEALDDVLVFHAGTRMSGETLVANGGRVLAVTATGKTVREAQANAYAAVDCIDWPEGFCRRDIGWRAVAREG